MNKVDTNALFSALLSADIEYDLAQKIVEMATVINSLAEETDAKRYSLLVD